MTKGEQVEALINSGKSYAEAAASTGVHPQYAYLISLYGGYREALAYKREWEQRSARRIGIPQTLNTQGGKKQYAYNAAEVIAAVDNGMSYGEAARKFSISRNVVAGVMNRRTRAA